MFLSLEVKLPFYSLCFNGNYFLFATQDPSVWHRFITSEIWFNHNCDSWFCWQDFTSKYKYISYADGNCNHNCMVQNICSKRPYASYDTLASLYSGCTGSRFLPFTLVSTTSPYCFPPFLLAHSPCNIDMPGSPSSPQHPCLPVVSTCHILLWKRQHELCCA